MSCVPTKLVLYARCSLSSAGLSASDSFVAATDHPVVKLLVCVLHTRAAENYSLATLRELTFAISPFIIITSHTHTHTHALLECISWRRCLAPLPPTGRESRRGGAAKCQQAVKSSHSGILQFIDFRNLWRSPPSALCARARLDFLSTRWRKCSAARLRLRPLAHKIPSRPRCELPISSATMRGHK